MFRHHYRLYTRILFAADLAVAFAALYFSYHARFYLVRFSPLEVSQFFHADLLPFSAYLSYLVLLSPVWILMLMATQGYTNLLSRPLSRQAARVLNFVVLMGILIGFINYSLMLEISRPVFFGFLSLTAVGLIFNRLGVRWVLLTRNLNEYSRIRILIVGTDARAREIGRTLEESKMWGTHVAGYVRHDDDPEEDAQGLPVVGSVSDLPLLIQERSPADEIIFTDIHKRDFASFEQLARLCESLGIKTRVVAELFPTSTSKISLEFLDDLPLVTFSTVPEHNLSTIAKRILDFFIALVGLIVFAPLLAIVAAAVKFTSPGPVFYLQVRCGLYGREFELIKFRTMIDGAEDRLWEIRHLNEMDGPVFKMRNDPRVTPLGRFLRKFSVDELPQLWNVLKGEMSVVGPRAPLPEEVEHYRTHQRRRLSVRPGITCLWQVSGRNDIDFQRWMDMDLQYIDNWSLWLDLEIMLKTIPAVFTGRGAR